MIIGILILALTLRSITLNQSLWWDEAINVVAAKNLGLWEFVTVYPNGDFHPPLYFLILWIWTHIFGFSEIIVRIPSVFFGVATVYITYLLGKKLFNKKIGLVSGLLLAIAPLHLYYSQEARMYSMAAFSSTLCFYFFTKLSEKKYLTMLSYVLSVVMVIYSDYLPYLIFPAQLIYIFWTKAVPLKNFLGLIGAGFLFFVPWLTLFPSQLSTGIGAASILPGWSSVVGGANLKELILIFAKTIIGKISIDNKLVYGLVMVVLGLFYLTIIASAIKKLDKNTKLLLLWITIPLASAFLISYFIPVLTYFRMLFILPGFYLLLAKGLSSLPKPLYKISLFALILISLVSISAYYTKSKFQREDWRAAASFIRENVSVEDEVLFENNSIPAPIIYYLQSPNASLLAAIKNVPAEVIAHVKPVSKEKNNVYLFEYLLEITDPKRLVEKKLVETGFKKGQIYNFEGVGFITKFNRF